MNLQKSIIAASIALSFTVQADTSFRTGFHVTSETSSVITIGLQVDKFGVETIWQDSDVGGSFYFTQPYKGFDFTLGISDLPDTAQVSVPTYEVIQDSTNVTAPFIAISYKAVSLRYYQYTAKHSVSMQTYDTVTKTFINQQTGTTTESKNQLWFGINYKF